MKLGVVGSIPSRDSGLFQNKREKIFVTSLVARSYKTKFPSLIQTINSSPRLRLEILTHISYLRTPGIHYLLRNLPLFFLFLSA